MSPAQTQKRSNQELRTRKDLLKAASRLMEGGRKPTMEEIAEEALVSRATAYRYFRNVESLLVEAPVEALVAGADEVLADDHSGDPVARVQRVESYIHETSYRNESRLRLLLAHSIGRDLEDNTLPVRQSRRVALIEEALEPSRDQFDDDTYRTLCAALSLVLGPEAMIVFRDVLQMDEDTARAVKQWAVQALVRAAQESNQINSAKENS